MNRLKKTSLITLLYISAEILNGSNGKATEEGEVVDCLNVVQQLGVISTLQGDKK